MICNKAEIHNHLLSEQEECLYCSIDDLQDELSLTRKALELACKDMDAAAKSPDLGFSEVANRSEIYITRAGG